MLVVENVFSMLLILTLRIQKMVDTVLSFKSHDGSRVSIGCGITLKI